MTQIRTNKFAGASFEGILNETHDCYKRMEIAHIVKVPVEKGYDKRRGKLFAKRKSTVDYVGFLYDDPRIIAIEAKTLKIGRKKGTKYYQNKDQRHQLEYVRSISEAGGYGFYLIRSEDNRQTYFIPPSAFDDQYTIDVTEYPKIGRGRGQILVDYIPMMKDYFSDGSNKSET